MTGLLARRRLLADAAALRLGWGGAAAEEARRRIAAATERQDLAVIAHWTGVWSELMRAVDGFRLAA